MEKACIFGPVVWGSVWGHGPELARFLTTAYRVRYLDPIVPADADKPSFRDRGAYGVPEGLEVVRRKTGLKRGPFYGLLMELRNLWAVISHNPGRVVTYYPLGSVLALAWCRLRGIRSMFVYADFPEIISSPLARVLARRIFLPLTARLARPGCIATSRQLHEDIARLQPNSIYVPNGVRLGRIGKPESGGKKTDRSRQQDSVDRKFSAGFVGFFGEWLDFGPVFEAASRLPEAWFVIVGDGPLRKDLEQEAAGLANVSFTGALPHNEVFERIGSMDACLVPFRLNDITHRVSPVKLFEYWALGKPVLATRCRELVLMSPEVHPALRFYDSGGDLLELLREMMEDSALRRECSHRAAEAAKDYDWEILGARIRNFLES